MHVSICYTLGKNNYISVVCIMRVSTAADKRDQDQICAHRRIVKNAPEPYIIREAYHTTYRVCTANPPRRQGRPRIKTTPRSISRAKRTYRIVRSRRGRIGRIGAIGCNVYGMEMAGGAFQRRKTRARLRRSRSKGTARSDTTVAQWNIQSGPSRITFSSFYYRRHHSI